MFLSVLGSVKVILTLMCWALSLPLILSLTDIEVVADTALIIFIGILLDLSGGQTSLMAWSATLVCMGLGSALVWMILRRNKFS